MAMEEIRVLTFDPCFQHHGLTGKCFKNLPKDWAAIQSIAAAILRETGEKDA